MAGQKWKLGRTEVRSLAYKNPHFASVSVIFVSSMPLFVGFAIFSCFFSLFLPVFQHLSATFPHWQNSLAEWLGATAWQNRFGELGPPLVGRNFGRKGLKFGRMEWLAPLYIYTSTPMASRALLSHLRPQIFLWTRNPERVL